MKTYTLSQAQSKLGKLADHEFDALIRAGKDSPHRLLARKVFKNIWQRGQF